MGETMRCGLIGENLEHSYSPRVHARLGSYEYRLIPLRQSELASFLRRRDFDGINEKPSSMGRRTKVFSNLLAFIADDGLAPEGNQIDSEWHDNLVSEDGKVFTTIARVRANTTAFADEDAGADKAVYRLQAVHLKDGAWVSGHSNAAPSR